jgi:hypothetical protein
VNINVIKYLYFVVSAAQSDFITDTDNWRDRQEASYSCQNINLGLNVHINSPDASYFCFPLRSYSIVQIKVIP